MYYKHQGQSRVLIHAYLQYDLSTMEQHPRLAGGEPQRQGGGIHAVAAVAITFFSG